MTDNIDYLDIIKNRDPQYDGHFYYAVKTTGIYCRPMCPARPKPENIVILKTPVEAESKGFRPCKRCRPDSFAPLRFNNRGTDVVDRAIFEMDLLSEDSSIELLAQKLEVTSRHLRRLFIEHLGVTPIEVYNNKRLHLARHFLRTSTMTITEIAFASGFNSLRRFNELFKKTYELTPSLYRKESSKKASGITIILPVRGEYDWSYVRSFLERHLIFSIESLTGDEFRRYWIFDNIVGCSLIRFDIKKNQFHITLNDIPVGEMRRVIKKIRLFLDVDHNPANLICKSEGVRIISHIDPFEVAITVILGQLVSTEQAKKKTEDLIVKYGKGFSLKGNKEKRYQFPTPKKLQNKEIETIGITKTKAHAIRELSRLVSKGELSFERNKSFDEVRKKLLSIRGIGPWSTEVIMMRCFYDLDAFPASDLIIRRAIELNLCVEEKWKLHRSYLTHFIWKKYAVELSKKGKK